ncbi:hypothetical protein VTP01DRAFT_2909 [Rhizomucor pusillus]|uniref:uncharacterized protein n=1 Tax=Rhizomucor pusillus TaxID=4840 RepID=UPI0037425652
MSSQSSDDLPNSIEGLLYRIASELTCSICLQLFSDATGTPCGHTFCNNCINESLKSRQSCPLCNHKVNQRNLVKATSAELLAREFETMRQAYEGENVIDLSQQAFQLLRHRADPIPDLSQKVPTPEKPSSNSSKPVQNVANNKPSLPQASSDTNSVRTCDSEATFVTSLEVRQAQEPRESQEAPRPCTSSDPQAPSTITEGTTDSSSEASVIVYLGDGVSIGQEDLAEFQTVPDVRITNNLFEATHFVAKVVTSHNRLVERKVDYLQAVMRGITILSEAWVVDCATRGEVLPDYEYYVKGDKETGALGAQLMIRKRRDRGYGPIFHDTKFSLIGEFADPTESELERLISLGGGRIVPPDGALNFSSYMIVPQTTTRHEAKMLGRRFGKRSISALWILDSISNGRKLETAKYVVGHTHAA